MLLLRQAHSQVWRRLDLLKRTLRAAKVMAIQSNAPVERAAQPLLQAYVRCKPGEESLTISLVLGGRLCNMNRPQAEPLEGAFRRIRANAAAKDKKAKKKPKQEQQQQGAAADNDAASSSLEIALLDRDAGGADAAATATRVIDERTPNAEAWARASLLRVGAATYEVVLNPPTVEALRLPSGRPLAGYPLRASVTLAFADGDGCAWRWARRRIGEWEEIEGARGAVYTPSAADIGCSLRVECTPHRTNAAAAAGEPASADAGGAVAAGPPLPASALRQLGPAAPLPRGAFRVVTYNILADQYCGSEYAQNVLFSYCPRDALEPTYRRQLVLQELLAYEADVIALQEVDERAFVDYFEPHLAAAGWAGRYTNKMGRVKEGEGLFWRAARFELAAARDVLLRDCFKAPLSARHQQYAPLLERSPHLAEALQKVTTVAQVALLLPIKAAPAAGDDDVAIEEAPLLVVNTHLFFHPYAPHIRSLHTAAILEEAADALDDWAASGALPASNVGGNSGSSGRKIPAPPPALLFCGDLNSDLNAGIPGVVELLRAGRLGAGFWDWADGAAFRWGKEEGEYTAVGEQGGEEAAAAAAAAGKPSPPPLPLADGHDFEPPSAAPTAPLDASTADALTTTPHGIDLSLPPVFGALAAADGLATPYTNFTSGYVALLDYVWYPPALLEVARTARVPPRELLASFIPSPAFPSDHLAVSFDFRYKQRGDGDASSSPSSRLHPASREQVAGAAAALARGAVVALPTDTLYGLTARADDAAALRALRGAKGRADDSPLAVAVADVAALCALVDASALPPGMLDALLPGPVTVLLPLKADAPLAVRELLGSGGGGAAATLGVRVPACEFTRAVLRALDAPAVALTSANASGGRSTLAPAEFAPLWGACDAVYDAGAIAAPSAAGSTVVDLTHAGSFRLLRRGVAGKGVAALLSGAFGLRLVED